MRKRYLLAFISKTVMNWVHDKHVEKKKKKTLFTISNIYDAKSNLDTEIIRVISRQLKIHHS